MPTLKEVVNTPDGQVSIGAIHLLLIGNTKSGKTDFVAQAAKDGYMVIYVGADNELATLVDALKDSPDAMERIHYFNPLNFADFVEDLLTLPVFRYNVRTRGRPTFSDKPDDRIVEIFPSKLPTNVILSLDSWTSLCHSMAKNQADELKVSLTDIDKYSREIYGPIGFFATQIAMILQHAKFHVIVQAHPGWYERKEKPEGVAKTITEKEMIIRETSEIPMSTSMPHGFTLGKHFNQIGWLSIDRFNNRVLDYRAINGRIGGGTPNKIGDPRKDLRFSVTFGKPGEYPPLETWMRELSSEEMKAAASAATPTLKPGAAAAPKPPAPAAAAPASRLVFGKPAGGNNG